MIAKAIRTAAIGEWQAAPAESENLACVDTHRTRIGRPRKESARQEAVEAEATGKVNSRAPVAKSSEESDGNIVPRKSANNGTSVPEESMEGREPTKRNSGQEAANRIQSREFASNGLARVRQRTQYSR